MKPVCCPTCRQYLPPFDDAKTLAAFFGRLNARKHSQAAILYALAETPQGLSRAELETILYPREEDLIRSAKNVVSTMVRNINETIRPLGWSIQSPGNGRTVNRMLRPYKLRKLNDVR